MNNNHQERIYNNYSEDDNDDVDSCQSDIEPSKIVFRDYTITASSADRDWENRTDETPYAFNVRLGGAGLENNYLMVRNDLKNVVAIGADKLILSNRQITANYSNVSIDVSDYPYLLLSVENINDNLFGTNKYLDNALGIMTPLNLLTKSFSECNYIELKNTTGKSKEYYQAPIGKLSKLNISIKTPFGENPHELNDVLSVKSITYLPEVASNLASEYLVVQTTDYFYPEQHKVGDIIKFGSYVYRDTGVYSEAFNFNTFINQDKGHRVIAVSTSDSTKYLYNRLYIPTPNSASVTSGDVTAVSWFSDLKTKSMGNLSTASSVTDSGKLLNYSLQSHVIFKIRVADKTTGFVANLL